MRFLIIYFILVSFHFSIDAQELTFSSEISKNDVALDEVFELTFSIKDGKGDFSPPLLENFDVVGGPNVQSSMQIINGDITQEKSYTYYIKAKQIGKWIIESAQLLTNEGMLYTPEILINVSSNTDDSRNKLNSQSRRKRNKADILKNFEKKKI